MTINTVLVMERPLDNVRYEEPWTGAIGQWTRIGASRSCPGVRAWLEGRLDRTPPDQQKEEEHAGSTSTNEASAERLAEASEGPLPVAGDMSNADG